MAHNDENFYTLRYGIYNDRKKFYRTNSRIFTDSFKVLLLKPFDEVVIKKVVATDFIGLMKNLFLHSTKSLLKKVN